MNKINIISEKDALMMNEFSSRTIGHLKQYHIFNLLFPVFQGFTDANVSKEIEKDRLIIEQAARAFMSGKGPGDINAEEIFEMTKNVDRRFLEKITRLPISIDVRYDKIRGTRIERISLLTMTVFDLLSSWDDDVSFSDMIKKVYSKRHFRVVIDRILSLYIQETRILSDSVNIIQPLSIAKDLFFHILFESMEKAKEETSKEILRRLAWY